MSIGPNSSSNGSTALSASFVNTDWESDKLIKLEADVSSSPYFSSLNPKPCDINVVERIGQDNQNGRNVMMSLFWVCVIGTAQHNLTGIHILYYKDLTVTMVTQ